MSKAYQITLNNSKERKKKDISNICLKEEELEKNDPFRWRKFT